MPWFVLALLLAAQGPATRPKKSAPAPKTASKPVTKPIPERFPLERLEVTGNQIYTREQITGILGLKVGETVRDADFEAARERLVKTGAFQTVGYRSGPAPSGQGYQVTYEVVEVPQVYRWELEELPKTSAEVSTALQRKYPLFGPKIAATKEMLAMYSAAIGELAGQKVAGRLMPDSDGQLYVLFRPDKPRPTVAEIRFQGNRVIPTPTLQTAIVHAAVGTLYTEELFRTLLDRNVRPLYDARGYVRAAFPKIKTEPAAGVIGLAVTVQVEEGVPYTLNGLKVEGAGAAMDRDLTDSTGVRTGEVANFEAVKEGEHRVIEALQRKGYMRATSEIQRSYDDAKKTVAAVIRVKPGEQFHFGELKIEGLDILTEPAIRKMWGLKPGAPFNAGYPARFLEAVREQGVLDDLGETRSKLEVHEDSRTVDVTLSFKGTPAPQKKRPAEPPQ